MVRIISDSTCDLSPELLARYEVSILPLHVILGSGDYKDGCDITPDDLYRWADEHNQTPKTAAVSVEEAMEAFEQALSQGAEVVCFAISESMSSTADAMRMAARRLQAEDRIVVIDSANLSTGVGLLVIEAARMAQEGCTARQIEAQIQQLKPLVRASFVVDTLTYLHRGGRCNGVAAFVGSTLKLHPSISVENGKMHPGKKYRGRLAHAIMDYAHDLEPALRCARPDRVFITHSGCDPQLIQTVREYLQGLGRFEEILITRAGSVISSHCGPGTLGILFIAETK